MALSADDRKAFWRDQRDSLNRIRSRLSDRETPPHYSPAASPSGRRSHSPYGKYRKSASPAYLPRLDTPPKHRKERLRGQKYGVVPPVQPRGSHRSPSVDYDSWGEESEDDDSDPDDPPHHSYMPQMYPYPSSYGYPAYQQPTVMYGPPFPVFYPPPPQYKGRNRRRPKQKEPNYLPVHQSYNPSKPHKSHKDLRYSLPEKRDYGYDFDRDYNHDRKRRDDVKDDVIKRYKYIHPRDSPYSPRPKDDLVDKRILQGDIVPGHPYYLPSKETAEDILDDAVSHMITSTVREALNDMVNEYMGQRGGEDWLQALVNERMSKSVYEEILDDFIEENKEELISDVILEMTVEEIIEDEVIAPEVEDESDEIARKILNHFDTKLMRKELKAVSQVAFDRMMEGFILDNVLLLISRQGKVWGENDHYNKIMDDFLLDILLEQYNLVREKRSKTIECKPLRKIHEKVATDVALDLLLQQLSSSLDEDLADVDEYERGVDGSNVTSGTPIVPAHAQSKLRVS